MASADTDKIVMPTPVCSPDLWSKITAGVWEDDDDAKNAPAKATTPSPIWSCRFVIPPSLKIKPTTRRKEVAELIGMIGLETNMPEIVGHTRIALRLDDQQTAAAAAELQVANVWMYRDMTDHYSEHRAMEQFAARYIPTASSQTKDAKRNMLTKVRSSYFVLIQVHWVQETTEREFLVYVPRAMVAVSRPVSPPRPS